MEPSVIVAIISLIGTLAGSFIGVLTSAKLTTYRIEKLEERINAMDTLDERLDKIEIKLSIQETIVEQVRKEVERNFKLSEVIKNADA